VQDRSLTNGRGSYHNCDDCPAAGADEAESSIDRLWGPFQTSKKSVQSCLIRDIVEGTAVYSASSKPPKLGAVREMGVIARFLELLRPEPIVYKHQSHKSTTGITESQIRHMCSVVKGQDSLVAMISRINSFIDFKYLSTFPSAILFVSKPCRSHDRLPFLLF
jgi:hypothetical protein